MSGLIIPLNDMKQMAGAMAPLFQKKPEDLFALMLIAQAEGKHPAIAAQEYDIIQGRPAINSKSALARFQGAGGRVQWIERTPEKCTLALSHSQGGELEVTWTMERASKAGLTGKDNWKKYPTEMLAARCVAEGVRAVFPACLNGMYTNEEVQDFAPIQRQKPIVTHAEVIRDERKEKALALFKEKSQGDKDKEAILLAEIEIAIGKPAKEAQGQDFDKMIEVLETF